MYKVNKHADKHARSRKKNKRDKWHVTRVKSHMIRSLPASSPERSGDGAGKGRRACNYVSGI